MTGFWILIKLWFKFSFLTLNNISLIKCRNDKRIQAIVGFFFSLSLSLSQTITHSFTLSFSFRKKLNPFSISLSLSLSVSLSLSLTLFSHSHYHLEPNLNPLSAILFAVPGSSACTSSDNGSRRTTFGSTDLKTISR